MRCSRSPPSRSPRRRARRRRARPGRSWCSPPRASTNAFEDIGRAWTARGGAPVRFSFAASSTLARQIEQGAPAAIFASARPRVDGLADRAQARRPLDRADARDQPAGRWSSPADRPATIALEPGTDVAAAFPAGRIATGDPAHVPVGRYAQQALEKLGAVGRARAAPRARRQRPLGARAGRARRGPLGIVYATDAAVAPRVRDRGRVPGVDATRRIVYPVARLAARDDAAAQAFFDFLVGPEARRSCARPASAIPAPRERRARDRGRDAQALRLSLAGRDAWRPRLLLPIAHRGWPTRWRAGASPAGARWTRWCTCRWCCRRSSSASVLLMLFGARGADRAPLQRRSASRLVFTTDAARRSRPR